MRSFLMKDKSIKKQTTMTEALERIEHSILKINKHQILALSEDQECTEYFGFNFYLGQVSIKFRKAKVTPKKTGQFVTLWKRNAKKETEPFNVKDHFDFYIIATEEENKFGFFIFPKHILGENQILTVNNKEGKRGFRVYPDWVKPESSQADKTKSWQTNYFIDLANGGLNGVEKFNRIISTTSARA